MIQIHEPKEITPRQDTLYQRHRASRVHDAIVYKKYENGDIVGRKIIIICGDGAAGKDMVANILRNITPLRYNTSTSEAAKDMIFAEIKAGIFDANATSHDATETCKLIYGRTGLNHRALQMRQEMQRQYDMPMTKWHDSRSCWSDRRKHRQFWADWIDWFNVAYTEDGKYPVGLGLYARMISLNQDLLTGIRRRREFDVCREQFNCLSIWVTRQDCPADPTCEIQACDCDFIIENPFPYRCPPTLQEVRLSYECDLANKLMRIFRNWHSVE